VSETPKEVPHDLTAEQAVLGCLFRNPESLPLVRLVLPSPKMFYNQGYGMIYRSICKVADKKDPVDQVVVGNEMIRLGYLEKVGGPLIFDQLKEFAVPAAIVEKYAKIVAKMFTLREVIKTSRDVAEMARRIPDDVSEFYSESKGMLAKAYRSSEYTTNAITAESGAMLVWNHLDNESTATKKAYIPTGLLGFEMPRGIVTTIGGRTSNCKTALALNMELNMARMGFKCLHMSLEDNAVRFYIRVMANIAGVINTNISTGQVTNDDRSKLIDAAEKMRELPLSVCAKKGVSVDFIKQYATTHQEAFGLDVLVVDYIQLLKGYPGQKNYEKISEAMQDLVVTAEELNVALIAVSQVSRPPEKGGTPRPPTMHDLKESGEIENSSKVIILVHRPYVYNKEEDPFRLDINFAKVSEGQTGERVLYGDMPHMWIGERVNAAGVVAVPHFTDGY
jgi:replicative DNA helicase